MFGKGICKYGNIIDVGVKMNIVDKSGSWFSYKDSKLGQGREKAKEYLEQNPDVMNAIETEIREKLSAQ